MMLEFLDTPLDESVLDSLRLLEDESEPNLLAQLLRLYLVEAPHYVSEIEQALLAGNISMIEMPAHSLRSVSSSIGALYVCKYACALETAARAQDRQAVIILVEELCREFERVKLEIRYMIRLDGLSKAV